MTRPSSWRQKHRICGSCREVRPSNESGPCFPFGGPPGPRSPRQLFGRDRRRPTCFAPLQKRVVAVAVVSVVQRSGVDVGDLLVELTFGEPDFPDLLRDQSYAFQGSRRVGFS